MPIGRTLKSGADAHEFTDEERRRGFEAAAAKRAAPKADAQAHAAERLAALTGIAVDRLEWPLNSPEGHVAARAVREVLERGSADLTPFFGPPGLAPVSWTRGVRVRRRLQFGC